MRGNAGKPVTTPADWMDIMKIRKVNVKTFVVDDTGDILRIAVNDINPEIVKQATKIIGEEPQVKALNVDRFIFTVTEMESVNITVDHSDYEEYAAACAKGEYYPDPRD